MKTKIHNVEQQSEDWFEVRDLKMTASHAQAIGNQSKGLNSLCKELVRNHLSKKDNSQKFGNTHTERGNELEPIARNLYSLESGNEVKEVGFIEVVGKNAGCSPDGLIGTDGGLEIKSPDDTKYFDLLVGDAEIESAYIWQVQMNLLITKRKWWDLVIYNPNFSKSLITVRIEPDEEKQKALLEGIEKGQELINKYLKLYNEYGK